MSSDLQALPGVELHRPSVLVVEDSPEDFEATRRAFAKVHPQYRLHHFEDGERALEYLQRLEYDPIDEAPPRPILILLDLNLPRMDGHTVIEHIQRSETLRSIPVVILTTSADPRDVQACHAAGAARYMLKLVDYRRFVEGIASLGLEAPS